MSKAFLDTTVLTDALLKPGAAANAAKAAISRFKISQLPVYAIKEFKAGPLRNFVWFHNRLVLSKSYSEALDALHRMSLSPRRYRTATAIEALRASAYASGKQKLLELTAKYGRAADFDTVQRDEYILAIKTAVIKAWRKRHSVASATVEPLTCYDEKEPIERRGLLDLEPTDCSPVSECCLGQRLKARPDQLEKLKDATDSLDRNRERQRRHEVLRNLIRKPKNPLSRKECRYLGDAVFAFLAPDDSTILTTNLKDHVPLAEALGKKAESP